MAQSSRPAPLAALDSRSTFWFLVTVVGSFLGFFLVFGPLGWIFGRGLRRDYKALGVRPRAAATATWLIGRTVSVMIPRAIEEHDGPSERGKRGSRAEEHSFGWPPVDRW